ncbi:MAG: 50S ribosomal protein L31 [Rickettsiales bacterium]|nr:50S ribosomal protein L31 [Rickettsiales bacterium]
MAQAKAKTDAKAASNEGTVHPKQHVVNVVMTDKTKFQILTTWGKEGDTLTLDVDPKNHPAWQEKGQSFVNANDERVAKFKSKFGNFDFVPGKKE